MAATMPAKFNMCFVRKRRLVNHQELTQQPYLQEGALALANEIDMPPNLGVMVLVFLE